MACSYCRRSGHKVSHNGITRCPEKLEDARIQQKNNKKPNVNQEKKGNVKEITLIEEQVKIESNPLKFESHYSPISVLSLNTDASLRSPQVKSISNLNNYIKNLCNATNPSLVTCTESIKSVSGGFKDHFKVGIGTESSSSNVMTFWDSNIWEAEESCYWSHAGRFLATKLKHKPQKEDEDSFNILHLSVHMHKVYINKKNTAFNLLQKYLDDNSDDCNYVYACGDWNSTKEEINSHLNVKFNFGLNGEITTKGGNAIDNIVSDVNKNDINASVLNEYKAFSHFPLSGNTIFKQ